MTILRRVAVATAAVVLAVGLGATPAVAADPAFTGPIAVGANADGRLQVFAWDTGETLWTKWQENGGWTGWQQFGSHLAWPAVARNADGRLEVFAINDAGRVAHKWQSTPNGGWSTWAVETDGDPVVGIAPPAVVRDPAGRLRLFAVASGGAMVTKQETGSSTGPWTSWTAISSKIFCGCAPVAGVNKDGRISVAGRTKSAGMMSAIETIPGGGWFGFTNVGLPDRQFDVGTPAMASNVDGRLELFAPGVDGHVNDAWQLSENSAWSNWADQGGQFWGTVSLTMSANRDGRLQAFAVDTNGDVRTKTESAPSSGPWVGWDLLGGGFGIANRGDWSAPVSLLGADGTMQLFMLGHGVVNTTHQTSPGSRGWEPWTVI